MSLVRWIEFWGWDLPSHWSVRFRFSGKFQELRQSCISIAENLCANPILTIRTFGYKIVTIEGNGVLKVGISPLKDAIAFLKLYRSESPVV